MKISTDQEKKWEAMWKKWEKPLPQDSNDDIFADMKAAVPNWKELVQKEFKGTLGAIHKEEFDNAIETVLDGEDPHSKKKFWDNCMTFERFLDTIRYVVQNDFHKFNVNETVNETSKEVNEATNEDGEEYATISELLYAAHKAVPNSSDAGKHTEIFALINGKLALMKVGKFLKAKSQSDAGRFVLTDGSSTSKAVIDRLAKQLHLDESELNEADDNDQLSHALDAVGVKASTANSKSQDEVQMTATDGDTYAGIDVAIDRDIDAAMEEIYC